MSVVCLGSSPFPAGTRGFRKGLPRHDVGQQPCMGMLRTSPKDRSCPSVPASWFDCYFPRTGSHSTPITKIGGDIPPTNESDMILFDSGWQRFIPANSLIGIPRTSEMVTDKMASLVVAESFSASGAEASSLCWQKIFHYDERLACPFENGRGVLASGFAAALLPLKCSVHGAVAHVQGYCG